MLTLLASPSHFSSIDPEQELPTTKPVESEYFRLGHVTCWHAWVSHAFSFLAGKSLRYCKIQFHLSRRPRNPSTADTCALFKAIVGTDSCVVSNSFSFRPCGARLHRVIVMKQYHLYWHIILSLGGIRPVWDRTLLFVAKTLQHDKIESWDNPLPLRCRASVSAKGWSAGRLRPSNCVQ